MPLKVQRTAQDGVSYVLLRLGHIADDEISVTALRGEQDGIALAVAHSETRDAPAPRAALELPGFPNLDFIPNNRSARVYVTGGARAIATRSCRSRACTPRAEPRGHDAGSGRSQRGRPDLAALRHARDGLPSPLADANLAEVTDPLQRNIREANIPVPISVWVERKTPLIEMLCGKGKDQKRVVPGVTASSTSDCATRAAWSSTAIGCRQSTARRRSGFEIDVYRPDGSARGDAHVDEVLTLRAGKEPR